MQAGYDHSYYFMSTFIRLLAHVGMGAEAWVGCASCVLVTALQSMPKVNICSTMRASCMLLAATAAEDKLRTSEPCL